MNPGPLEEQSVLLTSEPSLQAPSSHFLSSNEASSTRIGLHLIELLAKGVPLNPQMTQAVAKTIVYTPQIDRKPPLLKTIPTQLIGCEVKLVPT